MLLIGRKRGGSRFLYSEDSEMKHEDLGGTVGSIHIFCVRSGWTYSNHSSGRYFKKRVWREKGPSRKRP